ncbi:hypothetical protein C8R45DRAFT_937665 [Mycena sanguinolenta]|nr:hypothetical protein C8R45DRAFT_937665 [Mycena sanguinolenta]
MSAWDLAPLCTAAGAARYTRCSLSRTGRTSKEGWRVRKRCGVGGKDGEDDPGAGCHKCYVNGCGQIRSLLVVRNREDVLESLRETACGVRRDEAAKRRAPRALDRRVHPVRSLSVSASTSVTVAGNGNSNETAALLARGIYVAEGDSRYIHFIFFVCHSQRVAPPASWGAGRVIRVRGTRLWKPEEVDYEASMRIGILVLAVGARRDPEGGVVAPPILGGIGERALQMGKPEEGMQGGPPLEAGRPLQMQSTLAELARRRIECHVTIQSLRVCADDWEPKRDDIESGGVTPSYGIGETTPAQGEMRRDAKGNGAQELDGGGRGQSHGGG